MKKLFAIIVCFVMTLTLAACGDTPTENVTPADNSETENVTEPAEDVPEETPEEAPEDVPENPEETPAESPAETSAESPEETPAEGGKTLVVYYSATNNTEAVAGYIAEATGADIFELIPTEPYTSDDLDWTDRDSRVSREHDDESLRAVELESAVPDNWGDYDTVFIGYPIWWGIAAWPVNGFIAANDFTGKTVIPFCTSSSSGLGESGELLEEAAGTGNWLEGQRFRSGASEDDVKDWVASLEL